MCLSEEEKQQLVINSSVSLDFISKNLECSKCKGECGKFIYESSRTFLPKTLNCYCSKCKWRSYMCPFCGKLEPKLKDHMEQCSKGFTWKFTGKLEKQKIFQCCGFTFENVDGIYNHIISKHCTGYIQSKNIPNELTKFQKEKLMLATQGVDDVQVFSEGSGLGSETDYEYDNLRVIPEHENQETLRNQTFSMDDFFNDLKTRENMKFKLKDTTLKDFQLDSFKFSFKDQQIFESEEEILAFLLVNHYGLSSDGYSFFKNIMKKSNKNLDLYPSYDTIKERKDMLIGDQIDETQVNHFVRISIKNRIQKMCKDRFLFNNLCLTREEQGKTTTRNQPYQTAIFNQCLKRCPSDAFPFVLLHYIDDFAKFRTKTVSTCASYFTTYNWNSDFINTLQSIQVHGFSSDNEGFWLLTDKMINELQELDGQVIEVEDPDGNIIKLYICTAGFIFDTVEKLKCLSLMKDECSRCEDMDGWNMSLTPDFLFGSEKFDAEFSIKCKKRKLEEMKHIHLNYEEFESYAKDAKETNRGFCKGLKEQSMEEEKLKDQKLSKTKRNQKLKEYDQLEIIKNPFITQTFIDAFQKALVEFFHVEIQGLFRKHLVMLLDKLSYGTAKDDLILISNSVKKPNGKTLVMKKDIYTLSGIEMLDFIVCSIPIIHKLIFNNSKIKPSKLNDDAKKDLFDTWILHLQYFCKIAKENLSSIDIEWSEKTFVSFRSLFRKVFGENDCIFPNFHWITHLFEDCKVFGEVTWFWALFFELKHSEFKRFNDRSNKKQLELRGLQHEVAMNELFTNYPWTRSLVEKDRRYHFKNTLKVGMFVCFKYQGGNYIGEIASLQSKSGYISFKAVFKVSSLNTKLMMHNLDPVKLAPNWYHVTTVVCVCSCFMIETTSTERQRNKELIDAMTTDTDEDLLLIGAKTTEVKYVLNQFALCFNYHK